MHELTFIDLFAGIGGTRAGFEQACNEFNIKCKCIFTSEWDKYAQKTYYENFSEVPHGDIREIPSENIRAHNVLLAGFPCQPFSIAGVSKKNALGMPHGFSCSKQGNLFFEIERIIEHCKPDVFLLENVKHLKRHDQGRTYQVIEHILKNVCRYTVFDRIYDARTTVPQHRERIFLVGFRDSAVAAFFNFPELPHGDPRLGSILETNVEPKYTLSDHLWKYLQDYREKHRSKGNGFGYGLFGPLDVARTLSARYYKDGSEILIQQNGRNPRRLTPRECARLMGFPDTFKIPVSDTQAYRQFGNSIVVPTVKIISKAIISALAASKIKSKNHYEMPILIHSEVRSPVAFFAKGPGKSYSSKKIRTVQTRLIKWWTGQLQLAVLFPWRSSRTAPYRALVTEVLLQRTRAEAVNKIYHDYFKRFPTSRKLHDATVDDIQKAIKSLGLLWRAAKLKQLAGQIIRGVPKTYEGLVKLPCVGPYAAGSFLSLHSGKRAIIPDANMARILGRNFGFAVHAETRRDKLFLALCEKITPRKKFREFNYAVIDFGRLICKPSKPLCPTCLLNDICIYGKSKLRGRK